MNPPLETARLILRAFDTTGLEALRRHRSLPQVFRYVVLGPDTPKDTTNFIKYANRGAKEKAHSKFHLLRL